MSNMHNVLGFWDGAEMPGPESQNGLTSGQPYLAFLSDHFKSRGMTVCTDSVSYRETKDVGAEFIRKLLELDNGGYHYVNGNGCKYNIFLFPNGYLSLDCTKLDDSYFGPEMTSNIRVSGYWAGTKFFSEEIKQFFADLTVQIQSQGSVYAMVATQQGPEFKSIGHGGETLNRENYSTEVLKSYDRIVETLSAKIPPGRINIFTGPPGTGKTYLIRGLLEQVKGVKFAVVQASAVASLANPGTLPALLNFRTGKQPIVFIIEDAEEVLATRDAGNNSAVSALLNMGDGVLGSLIDLRIIATTNTKVQDLDHAIRRPGRLSTICEVGPLSWNDAARVFHNLTHQEFHGENDTYTIAEVYQMATDIGWTGEVKPKKRVGFAASSPEAVQVTRICEEELARINERAAQRLDNSTGYNEVADRLTDLLLKTIEEAENNPPANEDE